MKQSTCRYLSLVLLGSGLAAAACSDDDDPSTGLGGGAGRGGSGTAGSSGTAGAAGSAGATSAGSGGSSAGSAGAAGSSGAAGAAGAGAGAGGASGETPDAGGEGDAGAAAFVVSSPAFDDEPGCSAEDRDACDLFPDENTNLGDAANVSPAINWTGAPPGTQSFAIVLQDLAFLQNGSPFTHWVMWNIPGTATGLPANLPGGSMPGVPAANTQQANYLGDNGYVGSGACGNVYEFVLYALSTPTFDSPSAEAEAEVRDALNDSDDVLATATMRGRSDPAGPSCGGGD